jgi:hypothetical protein
MLIKKCFLSFCWVCVLCTTAQAAFSFLPAPDTQTAPHVETAVTPKEMACKP